MVKKELKFKSLLFKLSLALLFIIVGFLISSNNQVKAEDITVEYFGTHATILRNVDNTNIRYYCREHGNYLAASAYVKVVNGDKSYLQKYDNKISKVIYSSDGETTFDAPIGYFLWDKNDSTGKTNLDKIIEEDSDIETARQKEIINYVNANVDYKYKADAKFKKDNTNIAEEVKDYVEFSDSHIFTSADNRISGNDQVSLVLDSLPNYFNGKVSKLGDNVAKDFIQNGETKSQYLVFTKCDTRVYIMDQSDLTPYYYENNNKTEYDTIDYYFWDGNEITHCYQSENRFAVWNPETGSDDPNNNNTNFFYNNYLDGNYIHYYTQDGYAIYYDYTNQCEEGDDYNESNDHRFYYYDKNGTKQYYHEQFYFDLNGNIVYSRPYCIPYWIENGAAKKGSVKENKYYISKNGKMYQLQWDNDKKSSNAKENLYYINDSGQKTYYSYSEGVFCAENGSSIGWCPYNWTLNSFDGTNWVTTKTSGDKRVTANYSLKMKDSSGNDAIVYPDIFWKVKQYELTFDNEASGTITKVLNQTSEKPVSSYGYITADNNISNFTKELSNTNVRQVRGEDDMDGRAKDASYNGSVFPFTEMFQNLQWYERNYESGPNTVVDSNSNTSPIDLSGLSKYINYMDVYFKIIKNYTPGTSLFVNSSNTQATKTIVKKDGDGKKCIVGPYSYVLNPSISTDKGAIAKLQAALQADNSSYDDDYHSTFAWHSKIKNINGKNAKFVDANGKELQFFDFTNGTPFYIEYESYTTQNDESTEFVGEPYVDVGWYSNFTGTFKKYKLTAVVVPARFLERAVELSNNFAGTNESKSDGHKTGKWTKDFNFEVTIYPYSTKSNSTTTSDVAGSSKIKQSFITDYINDYETREVGRKLKWNFNGTPVDADGDGNQDSDPDYGNVEICRPSNNWHLSDDDADKEYKISVDSSKFQTVNDFNSYQVNKSDANTRVKFTYLVDNNGNPPGTPPSPPTKYGELGCVQLGGTAWLDEGDIKVGSLDGKLSNEKGFAGMQVQLVDATSDNKIVAVTTTDANGKYRFYGVTDETVYRKTDAETDVGKNLPEYVPITFEDLETHQTVTCKAALINPYHRYYVQFIYNGQMYQPTYYKQQLTSPGYSNAKDEDGTRQTLNVRFTKINSDPNNYPSATGKTNTAYGTYQKIQNDDGNYIQYDTKYLSTDLNVPSGQKALRFGDVWDKFIEFATNTRADFSAEPSKTDNDIDWNGSGISTNQDCETLTNLQWTTSSVINDGSSYTVALQKLSDWLIKLNVGKDRTNNIIQYIKDCMIAATTRQDDSTYPFNASHDEKIKYVINDVGTAQSTPDQSITIGEDTYRYLYTTSSDQSRYVDFGINVRQLSDLAINKDVYKAKVVVNGKSVEYKYNDVGSKDTKAMWTINQESATNTIYNGTGFYEIPIRSSDYLVQFKDTPAKNLQVYITYIITINNLGQTNVDLNQTEIADYYDSNAMSFDGKLNNDGTYTKEVYTLTSQKQDPKNLYYVNSYIGTDSNGKRLSDTYTQDPLTIKTNGVSDTSEKVGPYSTIYLTGLRNAAGETTLVPNEENGNENRSKAFVYLTFKVNLDHNTNRIQVDQAIDKENNIVTSTATLGKRNIAEINEYATYYSEGTIIPDKLNSDDSTVSKTIGKGEILEAGIVDQNSNPGSLSENDLDGNGEIKNGVNNDKTVNDTLNRQENDTSKSQNVRIVFKQQLNRTLKGYVFEDTRNKTINSAVIGDGLSSDEGKNITKINGVTVQLVELVAQVDEHGDPTGNYVGERIWGYHTYDGDYLNNISIDYSRYASGNTYSKTIVNATEKSNLYINNDTLNRGEYEFKGVPAGDFYIRFIYGDTDDTVLTSDENNEVNKVTGRNGLNSKSYNGQDYKSTLYQVSSSQGASYNSIEGYNNVENQNGYNIDKELIKQNNNTEETIYDLPSDYKSKLYYFDKKNSNSSDSDAKDVYYYREKTNEYSNSSANIKNDVRNNKAEILDSFERLGTYEKYCAENNSNEEALDLQNSKIDALENNTKMVAQTGIINTHIDLSQEDEGISYLNETAFIYYKSLSQEYKIDNINLGLVERPRAQLTLDKEIVNMKIILANGSTFIDTVPNLAKQKNSINHIGNRIYTEKVTKQIPQAIIQQVDDELIEDATLQLQYRFTVTNEGETDYTDKSFYYKGDGGKTISRTNANLVIDYLNNNLKIDDNQNNWKTTNIEEMNHSHSVDPSTEANPYDEDYVNRLYRNTVQTYTNLLITSDLSKELAPGEETSTNMNVSTTLSTKNLKDNLAYNNLAEIVSTSNSQGRRMAFSIVGNQKMADQNLGNNAATDQYVSYKVITPDEIDAASAGVTIMPPTGANKKYVPIIIASIASLLVIIGAVIIIKKRVIGKGK